MGNGKQGACKADVGSDLGVTRGQQKQRNAEDEEGPILEREAQKKAEKATDRRLNGTLRYASEVNKSGCKEPVDRVYPTRKRPGGDARWEYAGGRAGLSSLFTVVAPDRSATAATKRNRNL